MPFYVIAKRFLAAAAALAACAAFSAPLVKTEHVEADLVTENTTALAGQPAAVGLRLRMAPEWHTYWKNPGDSGLPTRIQWVLPEGWKAGAIQWPYPHRLPIGPLMNYGYEDEVVLLVDLTPPADARPGKYPVKAKAEWLVCKDICIPEKGEIDGEVAIATTPPQPNGRVQASVERARNALPVPAPGWKFESALTATDLVVRMEPPAGAALPAKLQFFPEREQLIEPAAPQRITKDGNGVRIAMKLAQPLAKDVTRVAGVAVSDDGWPGIPRKAIEVEAPVSSHLAALPPATGGSGRPADASVGGSTFVALAFALLGGILLNLMPCVFPVLGIKLMGFVQHAHGETRAMRVQGLMFFAGALLSFLLLAGVMLALRAGGSQLGWGFQLQSPVVVMLLSVLFFILALNLVGVFEWGAFAQSLTSNLSARGRYADAFLSGVLATVVATPCTAPFMGAAVGATLTQSAGHALLVFAALGVGMALPVLALSFFPALLRKLPRPGAWMETLKQLLAFPLFATVAWLAWVLGAQAGNDAVFALLGGLVVVAMAAWLYGRSERAPAAWRTALALLLCVVGVAVAWPMAHPDNGTVARAGELDWQPWSEERVRELTAQGRPVFVDFTAAWCVTCQVNKRVALHDDAVMKSFGAHGVVPLKADWTRQDPKITAALAALGRNAVPVYALYLPGESEPRLLPEVLTPSLVLGEIERLPAAKSAVAAK